MAKDFVVVFSGFVNEIKQSKFGEYAVVAYSLRGKGDDGIWRTTDKRFLNVSLEPNHNVKPNQLYKVSGELKFGKYTTKEGVERDSYWVSNAQLELQEGWSKAQVNPVSDTPAAILADFGATPF